jgi:hypothetical protein
VVATVSALLTLGFFQNPCATGEWEFELLVKSRDALRVFRRYATAGSHTYTAMYAPPASADARLGTPQLGSLGTNDQDKGRMTKDKGPTSNV